MSGRERKEGGKNRRAGKVGGRKVGGERERVE